MKNCEAKFVSEVPIRYRAPSHNKPRPTVTLHLHEHFSDCYGVVRVKAHDKEVRRGTDIICGEVRLAIIERRWGNFPDPIVVIVTERKDCSKGQIELVSESYEERPIKRDRTVGHNSRL